MEHLKPRDVVAYWRQSLIDSTYAHIEIEEGRSEGLVIHGESPADIVLAEEVLALARKMARGKHGEPIPALLSLAAITRAYGHEANRKLVPVLLIPVLMLPDGRLAPEGKGGPWIQRSMLSAPFNLAAADKVRWWLDRYPMLTDAEEKAIEELPWEDQWQTVLLGAARLMRDVIGIDLTVAGWEQALAARLPEGWTPVTGRLVIPMGEQPNLAGMLSPLVMTLDNLLDQSQTLPPLVETLATPSRPHHELPSGAQRIALMARHLGQMSDRHPLAESQRQAVEACTLLGHGDVQAIQGPPGTGKTTLIQTLIANAVVEAAVAGEDPAAVLVTSTNNNAITNLLDRMGTGGESPLAQRWIPGITGVGLYLAAGSKGKNADWNLYYYGRPGEGSLPTRLKDAVASGEAWDSFRAQCLNVLGFRPATPEEAAAQLRELVMHEVNRVRQWAGGVLHQHEVLTRYQQAQATYGYQLGLEQEWTRQLIELEQAVDANRAGESAVFRALAVVPTVRKRQEEERQAILRRFGLTCAWAEIDAQIEALKLRLAECKQAGEAYRAAFGTQPQVEDPLLRAVEQSAALDTDARFRAFWLAVHYWEARWLAAMHSLQQGSRSGGLLAWEYAPQFEAFEEGWRLRAMLFPCMVSTLHMAPKFFSYTRRGQSASKTLFEFLSLLIVEEAGQVSPELIAPTAALARRAVVVGDTHQIEPVWTVADGMDAENAVAHHLILDAAGYVALQRAGLAAHGANLQERAQQVSLFAAGPGEGLILTEHRRCDPRIIGFCNTLVYRGQLQPLRPATDYPDADRVPVLGYVHVGGFAVADLGSRHNPFEAAAVAAWLAEHAAFLRHRYGVRDLKDTVAIVTPFRAQERLIQQMLGRYGFQDRITIGTIHKLQGAERKVILLSGVYGYGDRDFFYDGGPNMLNVAVSRAEDSFIWFGNLDAVPPGTAPSSRLLDYLASTGRALPLPRCIDDALLEALRAQAGAQQAGMIEEPGLLLQAAVEALAQSAGEAVLIACSSEELAWLAEHPLFATAMDSALQRGLRVLLASGKGTAGEVLDAWRQRGAEIRTRYTPVTGTGLVVDGHCLFWGGSFREDVAAGPTVALCGGGATGWAERYARTLTG